MHLAALCRLFLRAAFGLLVFVFSFSVWSADLVVNHDDTPDPGPAGGIFTYTIRVDNNGPIGVVAATLSDTLPPGSTFVDVTTTAGACLAPVAGVINCTLGDIPFTSPVTSSVTVVVRVRLPTAGVWTNTVTAGSATPDPNPANNTNNVENTTALSAADLAVNASVAPAVVVAGENYNYTVSVTNNGPDSMGAADTQGITFTVPGGAFVTSIPTGAGWVCLPAAGYPLASGANVSCTRTGALAVGATTPNITIPAVTNVVGAVTASFSIANSTMPDGDLTNNTATVNVASGSGSEVSITKTVAPSGTVAVGSNVTYTLTPRHNGGIPPGTTAPSVITVTDTLGAGLTYVSAVGAGWTCDAAALPVITCTRPGPYLGGNFTNMPVITIVATVAALGVQTNTSVISIPEVDPIPANNTSSVNITGSNDADLRMTKTASVNPVVPGQPFNYLLTVRNLGPLPVAAGQTITVTDTLPATIELTATPTGTGWTCLPNAGFPIAGAVVTCTRNGPLAVNANAPVITVPVQQPLAGASSNTACTALAGAGPVDSNAANDCGTFNGIASATQADLRIVKTAGPDPVNAGDDLTYTLTVTNLGPDTSTNVTVSDTLGSLVTTGGLQSINPSQGTCTPVGPYPLNGASQNLSCNLGTMNMGDTATITVVVKPSIAITGNRSNTATVTSPDIGDPVLGNNSSTVTTTVTAVADVQVTKTASPLSIQAGAPLTYTATVRNNGPSSAQTVVLTDVLPANAGFINLVSINGGGVCGTVPAAGATGGTLSCSWASIASGTQFTVTYRVRPLASAVGGTLVNTASVTTTTLESTLANNNATTSTPVTAAVLDILVNKADNIDPVTLGTSVIYTITVTNSGPSSGTNIVMTDIFPAPASSPTATFSYQGALTVNAGGVCVEPALGVTSGTLTCTFPTLDGGQVATVTYTMRAETLTIGGALTGTAFNEASVTVNEPETTLLNNRVTHDTTARRFAEVTDLSITKTTPPVCKEPGNALVYTITVTNVGPAVSTAAQVIDALPAGVTFVSAPGCVLAAGTVTCPVGVLAVGASRVFTINLTLNNPYAGADPLLNTAIVDSPGDPVAGNNSAVASVSLCGAGPVPIPTLSEWAMMLLAGLMMLVAIGYQKRRA